MDHIELVQRAARHEIKYQIDEFRRMNPSFYSPTTRTHVAHIGPKEFRHLLTDFLKDEGALGDIESSVKIIRKPGRKSHESEFEDAGLAERWRRYHNENAKLAIQSAKENLTTAKSPTLRRAIKVETLTKKAVEKAMYLFREEMEKINESMTTKTRRQKVVEQPASVVEEVVASSSSDDFASTPSYRCKGCRSFDLYGQKQYCSDCYFVICASKAACKGDSGKTTIDSGFSKCYTCRMMKKCKGGCGKYSVKKDSKFEVCYNCHMKK